MSNNVEVGLTLIKIHMRLMLLKLEVFQRQVLLKAEKDDLYAEISIDNEWKEKN